MMPHDIKKRATPDTDMNITTINLMISNKTKRRCCMGGVRVSVRKDIYLSHWERAVVRVRSIKRLGFDARPTVFTASRGSNCVTNSQVRHL
jgi:hypothetical protein